MMGLPLRSWLRCEGPKPCGYYEGEAAALDRVKALRSEGLGFDRIVAPLNEENIHPHRKAVARRGYQPDSDQEERGRAEVRKVKGKGKGPHVEKGSARQ